MTHVAAAERMAVERLDAHLGRDRRVTLVALVDTIVPPDEDPGGVEGGVLHYLAQQFDGELAATLDHYRLGLALLDEEARLAEGCAFAELAADRAHDLLIRIEKGSVGGAWTVDPGAFFKRVVVHVMEGYYGDPGNTANANSASWRMVGFVVSG